MCVEGEREEENPTQLMPPPKPMLHDLKHTYSITHINLENHLDTVVHNVSDESDVGDEALRLVSSTACSAD